MKEHNSISLSKNSISKYINKCIRNVLNNISCPERVACYVKDSKLYVYLNGGDKFIYDPSDKTIEKQDEYILGWDFNEFIIDTKSLDQIFEKKQIQVKKKDEHGQLREQFGIIKKRITKKDLDEISKYKQAMKK